MVLVCAGAALGLVNPQLQPSHLVSRHKAVIGGEITQADSRKGVVVFRVTRVCMGEFAPREVTIRVPEAPAGEPSLLDDAAPGAVIVAYVGKTRKGREGDGLVYAGHQWHEVQMPDLAQPAAWKWADALGDDMAGTFNGAAEQLLAMMSDAADKRDFFPAYPAVKFKDDLNVAAFTGGPVRGVALYDIDGDGRPDVYACHESGGRAFIQVAPLKFEDRTAALGLAGVKGASCSFADVNGDGYPDLLAGGVIYLGAKAGFSRSDLLPASADRQVKCAAFVDASGDGYPDVVVSRVQGGLSLYLNPGAKGGAFADATSAAGLDRPQCGAGETGFFAPGDFSGDGRVDLYYAVRKGLILVQDAKGGFSPLAHKIDFDYKTPGAGGPGLTGGGCFAPLWRPDTWDLVAAGDMHLTIVTSAGGTPVNVTRHANEVKVCRVSQLATLAEDLDMDGNVDLLTLVRDAGVKNIYHANRGYGSFMLPELYDAEGFPGKAYAAGAWGAAAGDVDGDGATDLVLGGADGVLRIMLSDAFGHALRQPREHPTLMEQKLRQTRILTVRVAGPIGVLGADVRLADKAGRLVRRHVIGSQVLTGCRGPDTVNLAVREPGPHTLTVRFSDGLMRQWPVDLTNERRVVLVADRSRGR